MNNITTRKQYDREELKRFAYDGGFLNIIMTYLPQGTFLDGEIEALGGEISSIICDGRAESNQTRLFELVGKVAKLLNYDATSLLTPALLHIDEYAVRPYQLFSMLYTDEFGNNFSKFHWESPNVLCVCARLGNRKQECKFHMSANDTCMDTIICKLPLSQINANLGSWLNKLHRVLTLIGEVHYSVSPALIREGDSVFLKLGAHIPGKNVSIADCLFYAKELCRIGDQLELAFGTAEDLN